MRREWTIGLVYLLTFLRLASAGPGDWLAMAAGACAGAVLFANLDPGSRVPAWLLLVGNPLWVQLSRTEWRAAAACSLVVLACASLRNGNWRWFAGASGTCVAIAGYAGLPALLTAAAAWFSPVKRKPPLWTIAAGCILASGWFFWGNAANSAGRWFDPVLLLCALLSVRSLWRARANLTGNTLLLWVVASMLLGAAAPQWRTACILTAVPALCWSAALYGPAGRWSGLLAIVTIGRAALGL